MSRLGYCLPPHPFKISGYAPVTVARYFHKDGIVCVTLVVMQCLEILTKHWTYVVEQYDCYVIPVINFQ